MGAKRRSSIIRTPNVETDVLGGGKFRADSCCIMSLRRWNFHYASQVRLLNSVQLLWWIGVFSFAIYSQESTGEDTVDIGAIFSLQTVNGRTSQIAMQAAVDDINSDPSVLGGRQLALHFHDSNSSGFLSIVGALQFMELDVVAIIGPQSSTMAHVLSNFGNKLHVPLLSFIALDPMLTPLQYPYFVQTAPNDLVQMRAIAEMISYFGWTHVTAIFSDDDQSRNGIMVLGDQLSERRCKISYKAPLPPASEADDLSTKNVLNQVKMMESRVIVVHLTTSYGPRFLKMVEELEMMVDGYVWIATSWLATMLDAHPQLYSDRNRSNQGMITLRPHFPDSERKRAFASRWTQLTNGSIGLTAYSLYAYDTVWMLAFALKAFWSQGYNISFSDDPELASIGGKTLSFSQLSNFNEGPKLLELILKTNMTGLTGLIHYVDESRSLFQPSFDILNVAGDGVRLIGYWSNHSGLSTETPETLYSKPQNRSFASQELNGVVWPGGTTKKPRGWVFPDNGRKLRVGVPYRVSFQEFVSVDNHSNTVDGYCIDVFRAAVELLPYPVPFEFIYFGDRHRNPSYAELVNRIRTNEFDAVIGDIAIVTNRTKDIDFTQPFAESGLVVVVPIKKLNLSSWTFLRPFSASMWAVTGSFFLIVGAIVWILEHRLNDEFRGPPKKQVTTIVWFSFSTMFFAHRETVVSTLGRMVLFIWLFVVLIIQSSYTASLTSYLTVQQLSPQIKGIDSLISSNSKIGVQVGSFAENYLNEELSIPRTRIITLNSPEEYARALTHKAVAAVVDERPYIDLFLAEYCEFSIVGQEFTKGGWGFAFPSDSPLAVHLSTAILQLSEDGKLQNITEKWRAKVKAGSCSQKSSAQGSDQLQLNNFTGLFLICGFTCFVALILNFWMILHKYKRNSPELADDPSSRGSSRISSHSVRLKSFFSFADRREVEDLERQVKRKRTSTSFSLNEGDNNNSLALHVPQDE